MAHHKPDIGARAMERLLAEAAAARGISVRAIGGGAESAAGAVTPAGAGWILRFTQERPGQKPLVRHAHGFCLDLNCAATHLLAMDKAGTSDALAAAGIASIEHKVYLHPKLGPFVAREGNWPSMLAYASRHGMDVVVKDNAGTGGYGVRRVRNGRDLERAVYEAFQRTHAVSLSAYVAITEECRFVVLNGVIELAYRKERLEVTGDGMRTVLELLAARLEGAGSGAGGNPGRAQASRLLQESDESTLRVLASVPSQGETVLLNWKHNLGQGAAARIIKEPQREVAEMAALALAAAEAINLVFGSVDVVMVNGPKGPTAHVLEINAGVMMESLANDSPEGLAIARRIYDRALAAMFE